MQLLRELGFLSIISKNAFCGNLRKNNIKAITLIKNEYLYKRTKYIDIVYYCIRDLRKRNLIKIFYILIN